MNDNLLLWQLQLAEDGSFGASRDPRGEAWVLAVNEQEARALVEAEVGPVVVASVECYGLTAPRVTGLRVPWQQPFA